MTGLNVDDGAAGPAIREALSVHAPEAAKRGAFLAIENHQDFTSDELVAFCEEFGPPVGICLDLGNAFPVLEAPLDFARRAAPHVRHVHLKDYRVQFTDEGYRLVRCAIGDGAVPVAEILQLLERQHGSVTAVLEPGALEARPRRHRRAPVDRRQRQRPVPPHERAAGQPQLPDVDR